MLRSGKVVEQGTHEQLLEDEEGVYHGLVTAQALSMGPEQEGLPEDTKLNFSTAADADNRARAPADTDAMPSAGNGTKPAEERGKQQQIGILRSFAMVLKEQRHHYVLYTLALLGSMGAGACYPYKHSSLGTSSIPSL